MIYIGSKDGEVYATRVDDNGNGNSINTAYLNIGELMNGFRSDDAGNIDLDLLVALPDLINNQTVKLS